MSEGMDDSLKWDGPRKVDDDLAHYKLNQSNPNDAWKAKAWDYPNDVQLGNPVGESDQHGTLPDIVNLFYERYDTLKKMIRRQCGFYETNTIGQVKSRWFDFVHSQANLIGIVHSAKRTKSGGRMVELEDKTGTIRVFVPKEDPKSSTIVNDDVLGVTGNFNQDGTMFWTSRVVFADILPNHQNKGGKDYDPISIAFLSDIHVGSKYFLQEAWDKMMAWFNSDDETAHNIKYFVLSGDCVDGIGVYPGQENNLTIGDVYEQYEQFARMLDQLPDHITPIILPGNHDAVRPAEPQPVLEAGIQQKFNSAIHTGNPARLRLSGIDVLSYHGKGIDDMVPRMNHVTYEAPAEAMKEMLKKRHLAPMWGERNALSPEEHDQMVIRDIPDLFVTGHTHAHQVEWYRGTPLVVSSTMQGQSDFMRMMGYQPKIGYLTAYNIQNRQFRIISFNE
jgi:DNA polymerase II small subunit